MPEFKSIITAVKNAKPLVHSITNYVTVNDVANAILACNARPIMSDEPCEASEITSISNALNVNIGTITKRTKKAMEISIKTASKFGIPAVLDCTGCGASKFRTETCRKFTEQFKFSVVKGNSSEISALLGEKRNTRGVDAVQNSCVDIERVKDFASLHECVVAVTGKTDLITDGTQVCTVKNGEPLMADITGTGCMLSGIMAGMLSVKNAGNSVFDIAVCSTVLSGVAGQIAQKRMQENDGNASFRTYFIDAISTLCNEKDLKTLIEESNYEIQ